jgi:hypothetical protein
LIVDITQNKKEINERYVNSFGEDDLKSMFNLVLPEQIINKTLFTLRNGTNIDFNVYIITGLRVKK